MGRMSSEDFVYSDIFKPIQIEEAKGPLIQSLMEYNKFNNFNPSVNKLDLLFTIQNIEQCATKNCTKVAQKLQEETSAQSKI